MRIKWLALATKSSARVGPRLISTMSIPRRLYWLGYENFGCTSSKVLRILGAKPIPFDLSFKRNDRWSINAEENHRKIKSSVSRGPQMIFHDAEICSTECLVYKLHHFFKVLTTLLRIPWMSKRNPSMYLIKFSPLCVMLWLFSINGANEDNL